MTSTAAQTAADTQTVAMYRNLRTLEAMLQTARERFARAVRLSHRKAALRHLDRANWIEAQIEKIRQTA